MIRILVGNSFLDFKSNWILSKTDGYKVFLVCKLSNTYFLGNALEKFIWDSFVCFEKVYFGMKEKIKYSFVRLGTYEIYCVGHISASLNNRIHIKEL